MTQLYLAPIKGVTDAIFRKALAENFGGYDLAVAPFVRTGGHARKSNAFASVLPKSNLALPVVPQLLSKNASDFVDAVLRLADLGHKTVNWNLGCPFPTAVTRRLGAGLLPFHSEILSFLNEVMGRIPIGMSIKTRIGWEDSSELLKLIEPLNEFPLEEIIVHPRLGIQMYEGTCDVEAFEKIVECSRHRIVYNGDIRSCEDFHRISKRLPSIDHWMIGRGAASEPGLARMIRGGEKASTEEIFSFHREIVEIYMAELSGTAHLIAHMRGIWEYLGNALHVSHKFYKGLRKAKSLSDYNSVVDKAFEQAPS